jgi:chloramphenicol 3-O-phosphotransferase
VELSRSLKHCTDRLKKLQVWAVGGMDDITGGIERMGERGDRERERERERERR